MVDILYNVIRRPVATDPDRKDIYHVDRPHKDTKAKRVEDEDAKEGKDPSQYFAVIADCSESEKDEELEKELVPDHKGKGKYVDKDGVEHLDVFV